MKALPPCPPFTLTLDCTFKTNPPPRPRLEALPSAALALELTESPGTRQRADLGPPQGPPARGHARRGEAGAQAAAAARLRDHSGLAR